MTKNQFMLSGITNNAMGIWLIHSCDCFSALCIGITLVCCGFIAFIAGFLKNDDDN